MPKIRETGEGKFVVIREYDGHRLAGPFDTRREAGEALDDIESAPPPGDEQPDFGALIRAEFRSQREALVREITDAVLDAVRSANIPEMDLDMSSPTAKIPPGAPCTYDELPPESDAAKPKASGAGRGKGKGKGK